MNAPKAPPDGFKAAYRSRLMEPDYGHSAEAVNATEEYEYGLAWDGRGSDSYGADDGSWGYFYREGWRAAIEAAVKVIIKHPCGQLESCDCVSIAASIAALAGEAK